MSLSGSDKVSQNWGGNLNLEKRCICIILHAIMAMKPFGQIDEIIGKQLCHLYVHCHMSLLKISP